MEDGIRTRGHPFDPDLSVAGTQQREYFGGPVPNIFMRLLERSAAWLPAGAQVRHGLKGTGFVLTPHLQAELLA